MSERQHDSKGRAVSPVIGVILMVAITVLLAATAASFFIGIGQVGTSTRMPTAAFDYSYQLEGDSHVLRIAHRGGDGVSPGRLRVAVSSADCADGTNPNGRYRPADLGNDDGLIVAGSALTVSKTTVCGGSDLDVSTATVTLVWIGDSGASSSTLWRWKGPSA